MEKANIIANGKAVLGIEFGSTRIKAVLTAPDCSILASGVCDWENRFDNGFWTYSVQEIITGLQTCYANLCQNVESEYKVKITKLASIGFSAMMHGYIALDKSGELLVPFRTWRNTTTAQAAELLTKEFQFNIPQRWSISHLYQAILNEESHVEQIDFLTTLSGYIHLKLTGERVIGIGDASGMFPVSALTNNFDSNMLNQFSSLAKNYNWNIKNILPKVLIAGQNAGTLTPQGSLLIDPTGTLCAGIPLCPPEGDAGTGMVATNSVQVKTGNVSAGTSVFAMIVMEKAVDKLHEEIDIVATPSGDAVAMVHCNNCTSDLNAWVQLFKEVLESSGMQVDINQLFKTLYTKALDGEADAGGLMAYNYLSGEPITGLEEGRPLFTRGVNSRFNLANFMRAHLLSCVATLKIGMDILTTEENVCIDKMIGHGGLFKTDVVGQSVMATALNTPVTIMETASEGGAWGIAVLATYMLNKNNSQPLADYLNNKVFCHVKEKTLAPTTQDIAGFDTFIARYKKALPVEQKAATLV